MDFERQKETSDEFRRGFERVFGPKTVQGDASMYSYGIGTSFPPDWTDEQVIEWNNQHCPCPFHASQRATGKKEANG